MKSNDFLIKSDDSLMIRGSIGIIQRLGSSGVNLGLIKGIILRSFGDHFGLIRGSFSGLSSEGFFFLFFSFSRFSHPQELSDH